VPLRAENDMRGFGIIRNAALYAGNDPATVKLSAPHFLHMQIVDSGLSFTINENWFGFPGHV